MLDKRIWLFTGIFMCVLLINLLGLNVPLNISQLVVEGWRRNSAYSMVNYTASFPTSVGSFARTTQEGQQVSETHSRDILICTQDLFVYYKLLEGDTRLAPLMSEFQSRPDLKWESEKLLTVGQWFMAQNPDQLHILVASALLTTHH